MLTFLAGAHRPSGRRPLIGLDVTPCLPDLAVVAGEASGDLLASVVLKGLRPAIEWVTAGIQGSTHAGTTIPCLVAKAALAVHGYVGCGITAHCGHPQRIEATSAGSTP